MRLSPLCTHLNNRKKAHDNYLTSVWLKLRLLAAPPPRNPRVCHSARSLLTLPVILRKARQSVAADNFVRNKIAPARRVVYTDVHHESTGTFIYPPYYFTDCDSYHCPLDAAATRGMTLGDLLACAFYHRPLRFRRAAGWHPCAA